MVNSDNYLRECLQAGGLLLRKPPHPCELCEDTVVAVENIKNTIQKHYDYPRNVTDIIRDLREDCKDTAIFRHYVFPNVNRVEDESTRALPDSVFKILLSISPLQNQVADFLFEKAIDFAVEGACGPWIKTLLHCFTTLDHIVSGEKIAAKLIDLLDVTVEKAVRLEIISTIPDIIGDSEHDNITSEMSRFLSEHEDLTPAVLDCLSYLCLSDDHYRELQGKAIGILRTSVQYHYFPNFVKFLLMPGRLDEAGYAQTVNELRHALSWPDDLTEEICSSQMLTASAIRNTITSSKVIAAAWMKSVSSCKSQSDHKPIDIVLLVILFSSSDDRQKVVENILCKHVKLNLFRNEILNEAFTNFTPIFRHYLHHALDLVNNLLKFKSDQAVVSFATHWYITMFTNLEESRQTITAVLLQHGLSCKQSLSGALLILKNIADKDITMLKHQSVKMLALLDKLDDLHLNEIREIMNILTGLAFGFSDSLIRDDMHMIIKKQLESSNPALKIKGILAAVQAVKYFIKCDEVGDDDVANSEDITYSCYNHLAEGDTREAGQIIELISKSTTKFPDLFGFFYDELSEIMMYATFINPSFLSWLTDAVTNDLQKNFMVSELSTNKIKNLDVSMQYSLNKEDELECIIAINIAELTLRKSDDDCANISILPSLCRLVEILHSKKNNGDLSDIDALLGCAVIMPKVDYEHAEDMEQDDVFAVLDCLIHCSNWFRELINGFAAQTEQSLRQKVINRIQNIEEIEQIINTILIQTKVNYKPTVSTFNYIKCVSEHREKKIVTNKNVQQKTKPNKKPKLDETNLPLTVKTQVSQLASDHQNMKSKLSIIETLPLRQLNLNVICLLNVDLITVGNENGFLDISSFTFILRYVNQDLSNVLISRFTRNTHFSKQQHNIYNVKNAESTAEQIHNIMPKLMMHLYDLTKQINETLHDDQDSDHLTSNMIQLQVCLEQLLKTFSIYFKWVEFRKQNHTLLKSSLRTIISSQEKLTSKVKSLKDLLTSCAKIFQNLEDNCLLVPTAVSLIGVVQAMADVIADNESTSKILKQMANSFLSKQWLSPEGIPEKGLTFNQHVDVVMSSYFLNPDIATIKTLTLELKNEIHKLTGKNDHLDFMKSISKSNFPILYKHLIVAVHNSAKNKLDKGMTDSQHIELWKDVTKILKILAEIAKVVENRNNLSSFLKKCQPLLKLFMSQGMPIMEIKLKTESQSVIEIFKELQYTTKFLQSLCCHSRLKSDNALMTKVPQVRLLLEQFIYKVKAALAANKCSEAFWMGNLKNKNLQGEVIASQESVSEENGEDSDGQLPDDNEDSEIEDEMLNPESKSVSDIN